jgi:hypothetical protein
VELRAELIWSWKEMMEERKRSPISFDEKSPFI